MNNFKVIVGTLVVVSAAAFAAPSQAATIMRVAINHASAVCVGSNPTNQNMLRSRPMGRLQRHRQHRHSKLWWRSDSA